MKKIAFLLLLIVSSKGFSQNLELFGKVESYGLPETGKIYWTEEGKQFDPKKFIPFGKDRAFRFKIAIAEIKKLNSPVLVFATDITQETTNPNSCVQRIKVLEIVNASEFENLKNIALNTDLVLNINCEAGVYYDARMEQLEQFVGSYTLTTTDNFRTIRLGNDLKRYNGYLSKQTKDYMTTEVGSWNYDKEQKILSFYVFRQMNEQYGLMLSMHTEYHFKVKHSEGPMSFESEIGVLKKR